MWPSSYNIVVNRKILFVAYGGGHIAMVLPVMQQLRLLDSQTECVLLALTTAYQLAQKTGEHPLGYKDFLHLVDTPEALYWGEVLLGGNNSPDVSREESIAYLGINYLDLIAQHGETGAAKLYAEKGRYGFAPLRFMNLLIKAINPDVVVATNSPRSEEAALAVAVARGVPSVGMVDLFGLDSDTYVHRDIKPDWTCVIAESVRQRLIVRGFGPGGVVVTGNPAFDGLFSPSQQQLARDFLCQRGWTDRQVILYVGATEPTPHPATNIPAGPQFAIDIEHILRQYVSERVHTALIVRYHPGDWFKYPRLADSKRIHFSVPSRESIQPLILAARAVVNTNSTVGLEAAVAGRSVVSIENSPSVHGWFSLADLGVSYPSPTHLDIPDVLDAVLGMNKPLHSFQSDGHAARRVARVVANSRK